MLILTSENKPVKIVPKAVPKGVLGTPLERHFGTFQNTVPSWNASGTIGLNCLKNKSKRWNASGTTRKNRQTPFHSPAFLKRGEGWNTGTIATEITQ